MKLMRATAVILFLSTNPLLGQQSQSLPVSGKLVTVQCAGVQGKKEPFESGRILSQAPAGENFSKDCQSGEILTLDWPQVGSFFGFAAF
jgi:hypothetical protein